MGWLSKPVEVQAPSPAKLSVGGQDENDIASQRLPSDSPLKAFKPIDVDNPESFRCAANIESRALPPNVEIRPCTKDDIPGLKRLTSLLLPIPYPDKFYRDIIDDPVTNNITLVATWHDYPTTIGKEKGLLIGAIRCRLLAYPPTATPILDSKKDGPMLYLSTLVLLSPYRTHGIATHMLNVLMKRAVHDYGITSVGAHVWEANQDGLEWYRKRGFEEVSREEGYYRRLKPSTAVVVQRRVGVMDLVND